jgi:hypothetical protein
MKLTASLKEINRIVVLNNRIVAAINKTIDDEINVPIFPAFEGEVTKEDVLVWVEATTAAFAELPGSMAGSISLSVEDGENDAVLVTLEYSEDFIMMMLDITDEMVDVVVDFTEKNKFKLAIMLGGLKAVFHTVKPMVERVVEPLKESLIELTKKLNTVVIKTAGLELGDEAAAFSEEAAGATQEFQGEVQDAR